MLPDKIGFIGLGLIGGAIAKTIHRVHPDISLIAYDIDTASLSQAVSEGVLTRSYDTISDDFASCRYIFLCAPVQKNAEFLAKLSSFAGESCIITDVGSVKTSIHQEIAGTPIEAYFIGGHPMCGSEKSGYVNATPYLFENAYYILTPTDKTSTALLEEFQNFIQSLGAIPLILDYETHDHATAAISHLPHILAFTLVNLVKELDNPQETMKTIAAGGFRDMTRIASSSPIMWQQICLTNQKQLLSLLDSFIEALENIRQEIEMQNNSYLLDFFQSAKDYRDSLSLKSSGPLSKTFEIYCDLIDETGGIATLATILAKNHISIKNIGIIHNREFQDGVLHIEFYEEDALKKALVLLRSYHYTVYER